MTVIVTKIAVPMVNSNGTSRAELQKLYTDAWHAANSLMAQLQKGSPHGRDYQNYATEAEYRQARTEHWDRVQAVQKIADNMYALALHVRK